MNQLTEAISLVPSRKLVADLARRHWFSALVSAGYGIGIYALKSFISQDPIYWLFLGVFYVLLMRWSYLEKERFALKRVIGIDLLIRLRLIVEGAGDEVKRELQDHLGMYIKTAAVSFQKLPVTISQSILKLAEVDRVPVQVRSVIEHSLGQLERMLKELSEGGRITGATLKQQYVYAAAVAEHHAARGEKDKQFRYLATALDKPSEFYAKNSDYFAIQKAFPKPSEKGKFYAEASSRWQAIPQKARVVVINGGDLAKEIKDDFFWQFVEWHLLNNCFGLKFLISDEDSYRIRLSALVNEDNHMSIDDFIVYGNECVFGRVDLKADPLGQVTLRLATKENSGPDPASKYVLAFETLWADQGCRTVWDLKQIPCVAADQPLVAILAGRLEKLKEALDLHTSHS